MCEYEETPKPEFLMFCLDVAKDFYLDDAEFSRRYHRHSDSMLKFLHYFNTDFKRYPYFIMLVLHALWIKNRHETRQLMQLGAELNMGNSTGYTPLHFSWDCQVALMLIQKGADINAVDEAGETALHKAAKCSAYKMAALLLYFNADTSIPNKEGDTAIMLGDDKIVELLLDYETDFSRVNAKGWNLLSKAINDGLSHVKELINRSRGYPCDTGTFSKVIDRKQLDIFQWLWNAFEYKELWKEKISVLHYALQSKSYEIFDYILESSKIVDVLDVFYENVPKSDEMYSCPECHPLDFSLHDIVEATDYGYSKEKAEKAIFILLSYGYEPSEGEALMIFKLFAYSEITKLLLHLDISKPCTRYYPLVPKVLLNPSECVGTIIDRFIKDNTPQVKKENGHFMLTAPYIYDYRLNEVFKETCTETDKNIMEELYQRRVPSLLELSRNATRLAIWNKYKFKNLRQFYTTVEFMRCIPPLIRDIITFKSPVYYYNYANKVSEIV